MKSRKPGSKPRPPQIIAWETSPFVYQFYLSHEPGKLQYASAEMLAAYCRRGHPVVVTLRVPAGAVADLVYANGKVKWYIRAGRKPPPAAA